MTQHITQEQVAALNDLLPEALGTYHIVALCNAAIQHYIDNHTNGVVLPEIGPHDHPEPQTHIWRKLEIQAIQDYARQAIADALAKQVPAGYKLLPVEPTPEMIDAGVDSGKNMDWSYSNCYSAMIAAAPSPKDGV